MVRFNFIASGIALVCLVTFLVWGLARSGSSPTGAKTSNTKSSQGNEFGAGTQRIELKGVLLPLPRAWKIEKPASEAWLAQVRVPAESVEAEDALLSGHVFGSEFASGQDALDHWFIEFSQPIGASSRSNIRKSELSSVDSAKVSLSDISGNYRPTTMPPQSASELHEKWRMIVATVDCPSGPVFLRLIGPERTVENAVDNFKKCLAMIRIK
jgi:hypothetical protein